MTYKLTGPSPEAPKLGTSLIYDNVYDLRDHKKLAEFKQNGLKLTAGETTTVLLSENPSTGYSWMVNNQISGDTLSLDDQYKSDPAEPGMVGVGGAKHITITALKPGSAKL